MTTAPDLLRAVGLLADGPVTWQRPVRSSRPGVFLVELAAPLPTAPVDAAVCGKWIERVATLRLDGARPNGVQLARRLASFWLPSQTVLYVAATAKSLAARVGALYATPLGERRPHSGGHWLRTLRGHDRARIWWAETDAPEEAELELLIAFGAGVPAEEAAALPDPSVVLPFANLETSVGDRKPHGLAGALLAAEASAAPVGPVGRAVEPAPPPRAARPSRDTKPKPGTSPREAEAVRGRVSTGGRLRRSVPPPAPPPLPPGAEPVHVTRDGMARLQRELDELRGRRPAVIDRIRSARELGDLRENSEYQEARREQSFLEGRIQAIEATLRTAVVVDDEAGDSVRLGSVVVVESSDGEARYTIVGPREANAAEGRVSSSSPLGRALLGWRVGNAVSVATPVGERRFRIVALNPEPEPARATGPEAAARPSARADTAAGLESGPPPDRPDESGT